MKTVDFREKPKNLPPNNIIRTASEGPTAMALPHRHGPAPPPWPCPTAMALPASCAQTSPLDSTRSKKLLQTSLHFWVPHFRTAQDISDDIHYAVTMACTSRQQGGDHAPPPPIMQWLYQ